MFLCCIKSCSCSPCDWIFKSFISFFLDLIWSWSISSSVEKGLKSHPMISSVFGLPSAMTSWTFGRKNSRRLSNKGNFHWTVSLDVFSFYSARAVKFWISQQNFIPDSFNCTAKFANNEGYQTTDLIFHW